MKKKSGAAIICEAILNSALLHCRVSNINSIVEKLKQITGEKFPISKYSGTEFPEDDPWIVELVIGNTKVIVKFTMVDGNLIKGIEVRE